MANLNLSPHHDDHEQPAGVSLHIPGWFIGVAILAACFIVLAALASWSVDDPSFSYATAKAPANWLGLFGASIADLSFQTLGLGALLALIPPLYWGWTLTRRHTVNRIGMRLLGWAGIAILGSGALSCLAVPRSWPLPTGLGGMVGNGFSSLAGFVLGHSPAGAEAVLYGLVLVPPALALLWLATGFNLSPTPRPTPQEDEGAEAVYRTGVLDVVIGGIAHMAFRFAGAWRHAWAANKARMQTDPYDADLAWAHATGAPTQQGADMVQPQTQAQPALAEPQIVEFAANDAQRTEPTLDFPSDAHLSEYGQTYEAEPAQDYYPVEEPLDQPVQETSYHQAPYQDTSAQHVVERSVQPITEPAAASPRITAPAQRPQPGTRAAREAQGSLLSNEGFELPELSLLAEAQVKGPTPEHSAEILEANARRLEGVLEDFGVKGDIINVRPGPVVTLYELEPAPGIKSSRVISLADDIARSMSAISARVAVVPGRNAIGIELPNQTRETVFLREMLASNDFEKQKGKLNICLGKTIGGEPIIADLARMPHLLVAGTTGSGKSVAINTMILSLLYRMTPEQCRLIMIDPKMLELSVYDGIPHLLTPVVTDPSKAVVALKWAVREMEDRYKKMSKIGVRNIDGFNQRVAEATKKGKSISRTVQTGFNHETGEAIFESEEFELEPLPFIVIIIDEMADLMMVAGKDIEGTVQRLAQMARAAGIHVVMATQRPSVDVITGTIKANFPTRISFQVTSKIDSRTILGEMGAEQLLGMGDMLYMAGGGRIRRLHGPFCADSEVEDVVAHLKMQGQPDYLESITADEEEEGEGGAGGAYGGSGDELYDKAINIVLSDKKASTSYIQRRLSIGYNRAATLIEKMEQEGVISAANHAGKREILVGDGVDY